MIHASIERLALCLVECIHNNRQNHPNSLTPAKIENISRNYPLSIISEGYPNALEGRRHRWGHRSPGLLLLRLLLPWQFLPESPQTVGKSVHCMYFKEQV
jgi:hypothetical protein